MSVAMGAGGACSKHGVYGGFRCPECAGSPLDRIEAVARTTVDAWGTNAYAQDVLALVAVARAAERVDAADADGQFGLLPLDGDACQALEALSEALSRLDPAAAGKDTA